jgi:demethylmenaquinone methyltransferase/2-methoxy-6-polyprenyl-1,4-benzoquinol methylase
VADDQILQEQIDYYRQRACEYDATSYVDLDAAAERISAVVATLPAAGAVLELACGTGMWTAELAKHTTDLTALDAAPETIALARRRCPEHVRFVVADVLRGLPDRRYDLIFFGFWLSHVPEGAWPDFFASLERALSPGGQVAFVDEHISQSVNEHVVGETVERTLSDGSRHRLVKRYLDPVEVTGQLAGLGWSSQVGQSGPDWIVGSASPTAD